MSQIIELDKFKIPLGGQDVELQQIDHAAGGMSLLRIRLLFRHNLSRGIATSAVLY